MFVVRPISWLNWALFAGFAVALAAGQNATPTAQPPRPTESAASPSTRDAVSLDELVDSAILQEHRLIDLMRNFKPIIETYIQEEQPDPALVTSPKDDDYFLSRLDLSGTSLSTSSFVDEEHLKQRVKKKLLQYEEPFSAAGFAQELFPDLEHFDRQNYTFDFVRWEILGDVRCVVVDVKPRENTKNHAFVGRIWVEDQDFNIVRFTGAHTSEGFSKPGFHFDSWRLNTLGIMWMPAYVYRGDRHDPSSHGQWFKAQTRIRVTAWLTRRSPEVCQAFDRRPGMGRS